MLPEKWVISKKNVTISFAVTKNAVRDQIDWIEWLCQGNTALYICFAIVKTARRAVDWRPLILIIEHHTNEGLLLIAE